MSKESKKPFCVKGGECIGNVPTSGEISLFVWRTPEVGNYDWLYPGVLIVDNNWHDLYVGGVVGEKCQAVLLKIWENADTLPAKSLWKRAEQGESIQTLDFILKLVGYDELHGWIGVSDNGLIEYAVHPNITMLKVCVMGWLESFI